MVTADDNRIAGSVDGITFTEGNCIKIGLPVKLILRDYLQEKGTSRRPFLLLRISSLGRPIFIQFVPEFVLQDASEVFLDPILP